MARQGLSSPGLATLSRTHHLREVAAEDQVAEVVVAAEIQMADAEDQVAESEDQRVADAKCRYVTSYLHCCRFKFHPRMRTGLSYRLNR